MAKRMLIDATHAEETRVAVVDGTKLIEFDYESKVRRQLKGTIFLAKVTRVEPSLQAAFVNFGGNRHGFLPFSEIHPDYYRIPIADREALLAEQRAEMEAREAEERAEEEEEERRAAAQCTENAEDESEDEEDSVVELGGEKPLSEEDEAAIEEAALRGAENDLVEEVYEEAEAEDEDDDDSGVEAFDTPDANITDPLIDDDSEEDSIGNRIVEEGEDPDDSIGNVAGAGGEVDELAEARGGRSDDINGDGGRRRGRGGRFRGGRNGRGGRDRGGRGPRHAAASSRRVEVLGGDGIEGDRPVRPTSRRHYKIQEVIKRGQIMLVQVSKEERGNKGAAVTSYLSLPGRYCVLMPNSPRGGGVSRKIANFEERKRMREILAELNVPEGMSVIMRTAGMSRTKIEIKRDLDYLLRLWDDIRELTLQSTAPAIVHEEGNLIRRAVRDLYSRDIEEIIVSGEEGFKAARDFMKVMMPSHVKRVTEYKDEQLPLFQRYQVESQIRDMGEPIVTLKSGGYLVINPTEALISIDVNSGRATRERHIEETALKTNLEAADEVARQLRLRDLGGLVVIDFIDMEDRRNNAKVERRLREALSGDRARIQIGRISAFGLMEMSRQRMNPSLTEAQFEKCPHCAGIGVIRTVDNSAILALRALEEEGVRARAAQVQLSVANAVAIYILNNKREMLADIERRYKFKVLIHVDETLAPSGYKVDVIANADEDEDEGTGETRGNAAEEDGDDQRNGRNRRNRRGGGRNSRFQRDDDSETDSDAQTEEPAPDSTVEGEHESVSDLDQNQERRGRRRGRRGGRGGGRNGDRNSDRGGDRSRHDESQGTGQESGFDAIEPEGESPVTVTETVQPVQRPAKVEPVYYGRRRTGTDNAAPEPTPQATASDSAVTVHDVDSTSTGQKKKGWWNRLVE
jgi:ribonuclease E